MRLLIFEVSLLAKTRVTLGTRLILSAGADLDSKPSSCTGYSAGGRFRNHGPSHQKEFRSNVGPYIPLDAKSAGFCMPGQ